MRCHAPFVQHAWHAYSQVAATLPPNLGAGTKRAASVPGVQDAVMSQYRGVDGGAGKQSAGTWSWWVDHAHELTNARWGGGGVEGHLPHQSLRSAMPSAPTPGALHQCAPALRAWMRGACSARRPRERRLRGKLNHRPPVRQHTPSITRAWACCEARSMYVIQHILGMHRGATHAALAGARMRVGGFLRSTLRCIATKQVRVCGRYDCLTLSR